MKMKSENHPPNKDGLYVASCLRLITQKIFLPKVYAASNEDQEQIKKEIDEKYSELFQSLPGETGWDRVKMLFLEDAWGQTHPDMEHVFNGMMVGAFTGMGIGAMVGGRQSLNEFISKNEATKFYTELDAKRRLNDHVSFEMMKSAFKWGWRLSLFTGMYLFSVATISLYRNKSSMLEYIAAGGIAGSLYKFRLGPKGMLAGGIVGTVLGTIAGGASMTLLWATGSSMQEMQYWRLQYRIARQSEVHGKVLELRKKPEVVDPLLAAHDEKVKALNATNS